MSRLAEQLFWKDEEISFTKIKDGTSLQGKFKVSSVSGDTFEFTYNSLVYRGSISFTGDTLVMENSGVKWVGKILINQVSGTTSDGGTFTLDGLTISPVSPDVPASILYYYYR